MVRQLMNPPVLLCGRRAGFTLIEVIVALVVLLFGVITMASLSAMVMQSNRGSTNRTRADQALYQKVEEFQSLPFQSISTGSDSVSIGGVGFLRSWEVDNNTPVANVMQIRLTATWVERTDTLRVRTTTLKGQT